MKTIANQRKGQVFSIDVLFALLPIIMIIGASLQYLYIAEEDMKTIAIDGQRETASQALADYAMARYLSGKENYVIGDECDDLQALIEEDLTDYNESYFAWGYWNGDRLCKDTSDYDKTWILFSNTTASSQERFMLKYDVSGEFEHGKIAGVSFIVEENIP